MKKKNQGNLAHVLNKAANSFSRIFNLLLSWKLTFFMFTNILHLYTTSLFLNLHRSTKTVA